MPTTRADLERMHDGPIPADELARCVEPRRPRTLTEIGALDGPAAYPGRDLRLGIC